MYLGRLVAQAAVFAAYSSHLYDGPGNIGALVVYAEALMERLHKRGIVSILYAGPTRSNPERNLALSSIDIDSYSPDQVADMIIGPNYLRLRSLAASLVLAAEETPVHEFLDLTHWGDAKTPASATTQIVHPQRVSDHLDPPLMLMLHLANEDGQFGHREGRERRRTISAGAHWIQGLDMGARLSGAQLRNDLARWLRLDSDPPDDELEDSPETGTEYDVGMAARKRVEIETAIEDEIGTLTLDEAFVASTDWETDSETESEPDSGRVKLPKTVQQVMNDIDSNSASTVHADPPQKDTVRKIKLFFNSNYETKSDLPESQTRSIRKI